MEDHVSAPAWAMTTQRARALLGSEFAGRSAEDRQQARQRIEQSIFTRSGSSSPFLDVYEAFEDLVLDPTHVHQRRVARRQGQAPARVVQHVRRVVELIAVLQGGWAACAT